jgi:serine O-acetyltransferase
MSMGNVRAGMTSGNGAATRESLMREIRARHPRFLAAVLADARVNAHYRGERAEFRSRLDAAAQVVRLIWQGDAFAAQVLYRAKARLQALGVPLLPRICHRLAMQLAQVTIGDPVVMQPGVYILHGQVVIDGITEIGSGVTLAPFVTVGVRGSIFGPRIEDGVSLGTGAKVIGRVTVGQGARIGANAVVLADVEPGATVVGAHTGDRTTP